MIYTAQMLINRERAGLKLTGRKNGYYLFKGTKEQKMKKKVLDGKVRCPVNTHYSDLIIFGACPYCKREWHE